MSLAASYRTLFANVDKAVDRGGYAYVAPLLLKTLSVSGLPVDELPSLELFDLSGLVFASHAGGRVSSACTWSADYGDAFFRVCRPLLGDFCLVCSFGGALAGKKDKSTLIFKFQHSTAFLPPGSALDLRQGDVDVNPD
ncbi:hypothetical protein EON64_13835, partial [archaeon]